MGYQGNVLLAMGDKLSEEAAVDALGDGYFKQRADTALMTGPKNKVTADSTGRVFVGASGQPPSLPPHATPAGQAV